MRFRWGILGAVIGLIALVALANAVRQRIFAQTPLDTDNVLFTQDYQLADTLNGDLVVLATSIDLDSESRVTGDAALMASDINVNGTINGDVTVVSERFTLDDDAHINGDITLLVRNVELNGRIDGSLTVKSDQLIVGEDAVVAGEFAACADTLTDERTGSFRPIEDCVTDEHLQNLQALQFAREHALLSLELNADNPEALNSIGLLISPPESDSTVRLRFNPPEGMNVPSLLLPLLSGTETGMTTASLILPLLASVTSVDVQQHTPTDYAVIGLLVSVLGSLLLTGLAALAVTFFPRQIEHIEGAIRAVPRSVSGTGIMLSLLAIGITGAVGILLAVLPPVGMIVLPLYMIAALLLLGMMIAGWITLGLVFGEWLVRRVTKAVLPPLVTVSIGTFTLFLIAHLVALLPFGAIFAAIIVLLIGSLGLGAALLTRMGTRPVRHLRLAR